VIKDFNADSRNISGIKIFQSSYESGWSLDITFGKMVCRNDLVPTILRSIAIQSDGKIIAAASREIWNLFILQCPL
jgi:hypothetical protein